MGLSIDTVNRIREDNGIPVRARYVRRHRNGNFCIRCGMALAEGDIDFGKTCVEEILAGVVYAGDWELEADRGPALDRLQERGG